MGDVYAAYDPELDRKVAVKLLHVPGEGKVDIAEQKARVLREAQAIARLSHPNVVVVHDVGSFGERVFVAMEFVDGQTLSYWLHATPRPWRAILEVFIAAGRGLSAAHAADLVHRDFKGENVMINGAGQVRVMDFGLARQASNRKSGNSTPALATLSQSQVDTGSTVELAHQRAVDIGARLEGAPRPTPPEPSAGVTASLSTHLTETGLLVGTPAYMAPEQFRGQLADARSDQFSFCVALYEAIFGQRPFAGTTVIDLAHNVIQGRIRPPPPTRRVPGWLRRALLRGLATDAEARWPSMDDLLAALSRNPGVRGWWYAMGGVAVASAVGAALAFGLASERNTICQVGPDRFAGIWEGAGDRRAVRRPAIAQSIGGGDTARAKETFGNLARLLDGYVGRWSHLYKDSCEATNLRGEQSHEVLDLKMSCLRDRLSELRALSDVLVEGKADVVTDPVGAATALTPVERCAEINSAGATIAPPTEHAVRLRVNAVRDRLVEIKALQDAGRYARALDEVAGVVSEARASGYEPVIAEALNRLTLLQVETGRTQEADANAEEALWLAEASHHDELVVELATVEIYVTGYIEHDMVKARRWINQAQVFLRRIGGHDLLRAWMLNNIGVALDSNGDREAAAAQLSTSLRIKERILGKDHPDVALSLANLADTLNAIGRSKEALELSSRGIDILVHTFGQNHPRLVAQLAIRADILNNLGRHEEALRDAERALAVQQSAAAPEGNLIYALGPLADAELGLGHPARAVAPLDQALRLAEATDVVSELPHLRFALARALWDSGRDRRRARSLAIIVAQDMTGAMTGAKAGAPTGAAAGTGASANAGGAGASTASASTSEGSGAGGGGDKKTAASGDSIRERAAAWLGSHHEM
jgi:hypothetical protein